MEEEVGQDDGQLQWSITLNTVTRSLDSHHDAGRLAAQELFDVLIADHRPRQAPHQHQRNTQSRDGTPQVLELGAWARFTVPKAGVAPYPTPVLTLHGVVQNAAAERRLRTGRVVLHGPGQQLVEVGEAGRAVDERGDGSRPLRIDPGRDIDQDEG